MAAANQNFTTIRNDTFQKVTFDIDRDGSPIDLTGATIRMMLRLNKTQASPDLSLSTAASGITITDAVNGLFEIDEQIISIDSAVYFHDMELDESGGEVNTLIEGTFTVTQDVTF